eukprot:s1_g2158.t1
MVAAVFLIGLAFLRGLSDFDLSGYAQQEIHFPTDQGSMVGTLILPDDVPAAPIAIFVHGDGPQDRFGGDGYLVPMKLLLDAGIGVFSWDKPGVGASDGNWMHQSMDERTLEAVAALEAVQKASQVDASKVGFVGFSQAGWVVPAAVGPGSNAAFAVLVGGAVNWEEQGAYYSRRRVGLDLPPSGTRSEMSDDRRAFVTRNQGADALAALAQVQVPFLAIYGADDLNVDARRNAETYERALGTLRRENSVVIVPDATHGLLRSDMFNFQLSTDWPGWAIPAFVLAGRYAFAPGVWTDMADWIHSVVPEGT